MSFCEEINYCHICSSGSLRVHTKTHMNSIVYFYRNQIGSFFFFTCFSSLWNRFESCLGSRPCMGGIKHTFQQKVDHATLSLSPKLLQQRIFEIKSVWDNICLLPWRFNWACFSSSRFQFQIASQQFCQQEVVFKLSLVCHQVNSINSINIYFHIGEQIGEY